MIEMSQLPRITREYLDLLRTPGKSFSFEVQFVNRRGSYALLFRPIQVLSDGDRQSNVDIQIEVTKRDSPFSINALTPVHFSYYGKLNDLLKGGNEFEVDITSCLNENGNGSINLDVYNGGDIKLVILDMSNIASNSGAIIPLRNFVVNPVANKIDLGNYGPIVKTGLNRAHGSIVLNSQSKDGWNSSVKSNKFAEWSLSFPVGVNWNDIDNIVGFVIYFTDNTKRIYGGLVNNSYNTRTPRGGMAGISDVSAAELDYERNPTSGRGENAYDGRSSGRFNSRAVVDMEKLFKGRLNFSAFSNEEIDKITYIRLVFRLTNNRGTIIFFLYPQKHLDVWNKSIAPEIPLSKRSLVFSSYYIRPTKIIEGNDYAEIHNINDFRDDNIRKMFRVYSAVDNNSLKLVIPRTDTRWILNRGTIGEDVNAFGTNNILSNFRNRVNLAKAKIYDVVLEDGTILAAGGRPPNEMDPLKPNQIYIHKRPLDGKDRISLITLTKPGTFVYKIVLPEDSPVVFDQTNNNVLEDAIINGNNRGRLGHSVLKLKPNATLKDLYKKSYRITVHVHDLNSNGIPNTRKEYTTSLFTENEGAFTGQSSEYLFFDISDAPQIAELSNAVTENNMLKGRFSVGGNDITSTIGYVRIWRELKDGRTGIYVLPANDVAVVRNNSSALMSLYDASLLKPGAPPEINLAKLTNTTQSNTFYRMDYFVNVTRGLRDPISTPTLATDDVECVIWRAATGNIGAFSQTMAQVKFKSSIPAERRNGNTVYFRILDSKGNRIGQSPITIGQYQQFNASLGVLNDITSPYLTIESYTDAAYTKKVSETRVPNALFGRQQTVASINNGQPFTAAQSNNLYMQYYLYPESLKITNVNPAITINDTSVINSKYVVVVDQNIPPQRDAYFFGHGSWRMASKMSGNKLYMGAPIYDNFPAGTKQDYFLEWQEGGELKGISGPHDLPTNIKSAGDNANIPNGFLVLDNQARGQLTLTADNNFITNTTYRVESVEGNNRTTIAGKGYTGFRQNPQATFDVSFPSKTPQTLAISQTKINVEMTVDNNLVTSKSLGFANNQLSSTAYGAILPLSNTGSTIPKYSTSVVKSQDDPLVTFNLNSQNRNNTIGKIAILRPGNNGLSRAEINHDGSANGIHVPFDYFTKAGNNDSYEAMFLLYGEGADANKVIGHAVISLPRNQLKEESPDYDFGLGQIVMILNKAGNGAVIKAMVPHGLLSRADEFVLLNERQPNSTYNVTMETGGLYDIVSIDGVLKDAPQPGSTVLQFGIRKDGELKRGKRITLTQLNTSVDVENHDNANKRVYSFGYGMADTSNRIDVKLVKIEDKVHVFFTDGTGTSVSYEADGFTLVHNSIDGSVTAAVGQIDKKLKRTSGAFVLSIADYPQLGKMAEIVNGNDKNHGVVLVHRAVSGNMPAIYHNEGFIHTSSELPLMNLSSFGVRYIRVNSPESEHGLTVGVGKEWYHRYTSPSSKEYDNKGLRIPRIEYTNANGGTSVSNSSSESERGIVFAPMTSGNGILPRDIQEGSDKYAEFTVVNPATNQPERVKLYKDPYDPRLYARRYTPRTTDVKYIAYHSEVNNQHILPLPGVIKRSGNIGFDVDYTLRRNALVRDMDIVNRERFLPFDHIYRIAYIDRSRYNNFAEINTFFSILSRSREALSASPYTSGISTSAYYSALLPDINQDFTENCGEVNKTRDLSDWQMEATLLDLTTRLDMSEYPIMEITGTDMQPISTDILRIRGPRNGKPVILNKEYNQIFTTPPRILVIEEDIQFAAAAGTNVREMILFNSNLSIIPTVIFRGRLIVHGLSSGLIGITQSFTVINDTQWDFYQLLSGIPLPNRSTDTNASTSIGTTSPTTSEATIDIVSEYIYERTGSTSLSSNIVGARKFISISKKDNLYGPYDNMVDESGNSSDLAVVEIAVKLPGDNNKYPIAVDKKTRHYVGDTVRYYISGNLPEPLRRNPWDDPLPVEIVTTIYRGVGNGSRYEIIRSARGRLVSWQHPQ